MGTLIAELSASSSHIHGTRDWVGAESPALMAQTPLGLLWGVVTVVSMASVLTLPLRNLPGV